MTSTNNKKAQERVHPAEKHSAAGEAGNASSGYQESYQVWSNFYQQMAREGMDYFWKGIDMAQKMAPAPAAGQEMFKLWTDNYTDFFKQMGQQEFSPLDASSYRKMYETWLSLWSHNLDTYMRSPEFIEKSGRDIETFSDMQKKGGEMLEAYWQSLHLPSAEDMREIYQKLYMIERKLDDLSRQLRETKPPSPPSAKK